MKRILFILLFAGALAGFSGCSPEEDDTIILLGTESYVHSIAYWVQNASWRDSLLSNFNSIPEGFYPPCIEGEYRMGEVEFVASNYVDLLDHQDIRLKVLNQHNRVACVEYNEGGMIHIDTAYVSGEGQVFSLYFVEERAVPSYGSTYSQRRFVLFTGEKTDQGIKDLYFGSLVLESDCPEEDTLVGSFVPGWFFVYKDKDGLSEKVSQKTP